MNKFFAFAFAFAALLVLPAAAQSLGDWQHKKKLVVDTTATGVELKEAVAQAPLALRLHTGNFTFSEANPDGADLRVTAADGKTPLHFHVESFNAADELALIWVQLPKLAPGATSDAAMLFWGNDKAAPGGDAKGTYDPTQTLVLHFAEKDAPKDATSYGNHPTGAATLGVVGPLGSAATLDGGAGLRIAASSSLKVLAGNGVTFTAWIKPADAQSGMLYEQAEGAARIAVKLAAGVLTAGVDGKEVRASAPLQAGTWQHVAVTVGGGKATLYVNGAAVGSGDVQLADTGGDVTIGAGYRGDIDEVTLASVARPADYVKALYGSQQPDSPLLGFADDDEGGGESVSYFRILLGAVTVDGWVVIGILIVMGFISVAVMVGKAKFLLRARKANDAFLAHFGEKSFEMLTPGAPVATALESESAVGDSALYRLYRIGLHEMKVRFDAQSRDGVEHALSGASLDAIRASIDAGQVRENQRLNSQIVLLTIAISGGPFLGLLGTVVGVMITFAAIAAAGDVNVNSIAPGIAAALVATVAGLGVAIPALFGYNWLASQIKNVSADMQVFADEFVTKAAELHSR